MAGDARAAAELVEFLAKAIVSDRDAVKVNVTDGGECLELETADDDRGRVIGRQGRIAKALRAVLAESSVGAGCRLDIVD
ncbi:MAG: KH domain-containing protein [Myxococcota bacterium]|nr:KH domain-containing protein [Myxococcales bacterium]